MPVRTAAMPCRKRAHSSTMTAEERGDSMSAGLSDGERQGAKMPDPLMPGTPRQAPPTGTKRAAFRPQGPERPVPTDQSYAVPTDGSASTGSSLQPIYRSLNNPDDASMASETAVVESLVREHLPLVAHVVADVMVRVPRHVSRDELTSAALYGLAQAARSFDPDRGAPFEGYARRRMQGALLD